MKILHIPLNEYDTIEALEKAFWGMPIEVKKSGAHLSSSKKKTEANLKYQYKRYNNLGSRIFWYSKEVNVFIMYEAIFD